MSEKDEKNPFLKGSAPTPEQVAASFDLALLHEGAVMPATYVNKIRLEVTEGNMIRLIFAEQNPLAGMVIARSCVILSPENAVALAALIGKFVKQVDINTRPQ